MQEPPRSYVLCGTPRTGSTLLCSLLCSTGVLGRPESYFREPDEVAWAPYLQKPPSALIDPSAWKDCSRNFGERAPQEVRFSPGLSTRVRVSPYPNRPQ